MISRLKVAFSELLDENSWMDGKTRLVAREKVRWSLYHTSNRRTNISGLPIIIVVIYVFRQKSKIVLDSMPLKYKL